MTRARLLGAGLPAPFERDPRNPLDRRARGRRPDPADAAEAAAGGRRRSDGRDSQDDTDTDEIPLDDA